MYCPDGNVDKKGIEVGQLCPLETALNIHENGSKKPYCLNRRIHADVIVYIFAHLRTALRIEGNMLDMN